MVINLKYDKKKNQECVKIAKAMGWYEHLIMLYILIFAIFVITRITTLI